MTVLQKADTSAQLPSPPESTSTNSARILTGLAFASAVALMLPICFAGPLVLDEHGSYWILDSDLPGSSLYRSLSYAAIPPLSSWLQAGSIFLFGKSEFVFRLSSAGCFLGTILVVRQLGQQLHSAECGALCALLMAWHPEAMDEARIARCYGLVLLLASVLLLVTLLWQRSLMSSRWALPWSLSAVMLLWTHYTSALLHFLCRSSDRVVPRSRTQSTSCSNTTAGRICTADDGQLSSD